MLFHKKRQDRQQRMLERLRMAQTDGYELCVLCGTGTQVRTSEPVELRKDYVSGVGQLCRMCAMQHGSIRCPDAVSSLSRQKEKQNAS